MRSIEIPECDEIFVPEYGGYEIRRDAAHTTYRATSPADTCELITHCLSDMTRLIHGRLKMKIFGVKEGV